tara:strand:+ start:4854 stop:5651 length:798 start_codon:yes stop_codon:yes gene_type:complete
MTLTEISREFDIAYDNISSNQAPGVNSYEKSVLLTKAQDQIVRSKYSPFNISKKSFETSENRRTELKELITPYSTSESFTKESIEIDPESLFFEIPLDVYYILQEEVILSNSSGTRPVEDSSVVDCITGTRVQVIPMSHDEYNTAKKNPFRKPNKRKVWRMDISKQEGANAEKLVPMVEIISKYSILKYSMRYLRQPPPIVLETFDNNVEYEGLNLSINNISTATECILSSEIQRDIIDRAVEMAITSYRENTLQSNVELNKRNI